MVGILVSQSGGHGGSEKVSKRRAELDVGSYGCAEFKGEPSQVVPNLVTTLLMIHPQWLGKAGAVAGKMSRSV